MGFTASKPTKDAEYAEESKYNDGSASEEKQLVEGLSSVRLDDASEPASKDGSISLNNIDSWEFRASSDPRIQLSRTILSTVDFQSALSSRATKIADAHVFNTQLTFSTRPITSQNSSGRCWLFATTNVLRYSVMKKLNLEEFELSQAYLFVYDKLNKANYYLETTIETAELPLDDRLICYLSDSPVGDGGQWDMVVNVLETYGLVPKSIFPESYSSSNSSNLNKLVTAKLREHSLILRNIVNQLRNEGSLSNLEITNIARTKKEELMGEIWTVVTATLGVPPKPNTKFTWDYYDKEGHAHTWTGTPLEFYRSFTDNQYKPSDSFSLINDPRNKYSTLYTVDRLCNVWGGRPVSYVNTDIKRLKASIVKMIKADIPVFFGCDVGKFADRPSGVLDTALYNYESAFNVKLGMTKSERLLTGESAMNHAMVITAVHIDKLGAPVRYKIENSWGDAVGDHGFYVMTDAWFDEFVYQVVVPKALAPKDLVKVYEDGQAVALPAWDPMGALA